MKIKIKVLDRGIIGYSRRVLEFLSEHIVRENNLFIYENCKVIINKVKI